MSQHDYIISDAVGSVFLSDLNSNLQAIVTDNSGTTEPTVTYANMVWADTSTSPPTIKRRNALNTAWVSENDMSGNVTISTNNSSAALTITQDGTGNCLVVNDQSGDSSPFIINSNGNVCMGGTAADHRLTVANGNASFAQTTGTKIAYNASDAFTSSGGTSTARYGLTFNAMGATSNVGLSGWGELGFYTGDVLRMSIDGTGNVGVGSTPHSGTTLRIGGLGSASSAAQGILIDTAFSSSTTGICRGILSNLSTSPVSFNTNIAHYTANQGTIGAGSTVTTQYGFIASGTLTGATNNFGFYGDIPDGSNRYNFYAAGTAPNYFAGKVGIGGASSGNSTLRIGGSLSGGTDVQGVLLDSTVYRTATGIGRGVITAIGTEAATFTTNIAHYTANQGTIGAGSTVANQFGFIAAGTLTGATNNYGFYGDIANGSNRYNFYAAGTAPNYYAGDIRTNTTVTEATTVTNSNSSTTLTAANLLGHIVSGTPVAGINYTLPTGTDLDTAFQNLSNNQAFNWSVINLAAATHAITLLANTAHTIVGNAVVQANTSGTFRTRKTAANTFVTYRIS